MRQVTGHRGPIEDFNHRVSVHTGPIGPGGAPDHYVVRYSDRQDRDVGLFFLGGDSVTGLRTGLTNEVLLAVLIDRLEGFQRGPNACPENVTALGGLTTALTALQERSCRVNQQKEAYATTSEPEKVPTARLFAAAPSLVVNGVAVASLKELATSWRAWSLVESALKELDPPATAVEWAILDRIPTTSAGRNGLAEAKVALTGLSGTHKK